jgi:ankyrin repeat protein
MKYIKLFESFEEYDPYELMITPPNKKAEMLIQEINKKDKANLNLVNDLIVLGAKDWQYEDGSTALHSCARYNHPGIAGILIDAGSDLNLQDNDGWTALHWCAMWNHSEIVRMLIDAGADLNIQSYNGWTALHCCARNNRPEILRMLIDAGADKTIPTNDGKLPYELATISGLKKLLQP